MKKFRIYTRAARENGARLLKEKGSDRAASRYHRYFLKLNLFHPRNGMGIYTEGKPI